eukprot:8438976-Pyramimonas_sp.AAC.1
MSLGALPPSHAAAATHCIAVITLPLTLTLSTIASQCGAYGVGGSVGPAGPAAAPVRRGPAP